MKPLLSTPAPRDQRFMIEQLRDEWREERVAYNARARFIAAEVTLGFGIMAWAWSVATPLRVDALPSVFAEIALFVLIIATLTYRDPAGMMRLSNPALSMLGWMFYYFIKPTMLWLEGYRMTYESPTTIILDVSIVTEVQYLHCYFMGAFFAAYLAISPRRNVRPIFRAGERPDLKVFWFVALGLASYLIEFVNRIVRTGSILPTANYGETMAADVDYLVASRTAGGADLLVTQILSKVWYFPLMALGLGYGVVMTRLTTQKQWSRLALFFAQVPFLLLLGSGSRSFVAFPFLLAFMIMDALSGPYRWWRLTPLAAVALKLFDFYGFFRSYQHQGFREGVDASLREMSDLSNSIQSEDATMVTKEAYCVLVVNHGRELRGLTYFYDTVLQLLPAQLAPEKLTITNTADWLSNELIGYGRYASGAAGTMVGDGYLIGGTVGVLGLATVLGLTFGGVVRWGMSGPGGRPVLWRYLLMLMISVQATQYIRADYALVLTQLLYYVVMPAVLIWLFVGDGEDSRSPWLRSLDTVG